MPDTDILIIGGGATGLGAAVDAASRGYATLLLEQADFAAGTSSRSTKLVHGGLRYLRQGNVKLVLEALKERGRLCANAPHLVQHQLFIIPIYNWWHGPFYGMGLKLYDRLAGEWRLQPSQSLSRAEVLQQLPTVTPTGLQRGILYCDGQFDDTRLAVSLARTAIDHGARILNYTKVVGLIREQGLVTGVRARDTLTGKEDEYRARVIVNATGVFADDVRRLDDQGASPMLTVSRGTHIVLPRTFQPGDSAIMIPQTTDGRVLFAVPWHDRVVVGTTDVAVPAVDAEPRGSAEELDFLLEHAGRYLTQRPTSADVLSTFSGLRSLVKSGAGKSTSSLSRSHVLRVEPSRLITVVGGKWTTYRKMAQDVIDQAEQVGGWEHRPCRTQDLPIHGHGVDLPEAWHERVYGCEASDVRATMPDAAPLHPRLPYTAADVFWGMRHEMARTLEDVLARRTRALFLDARAAMDMAPTVAALMEKELDWDASHTQQQVAMFMDLARGYLPPGA